jgi:hypothetical protein
MFFFLYLVNLFHLLEFFFVKSKFKLQVHGIMEFSHLKMIFMILSVL